MLQGDTGYVFTLNVYRNVADKWYSIKQIDTLQRQADSTYASPLARIVHEADELYLVSTAGKYRKYHLGMVTDSAEVSVQLNKAYYLDQFVAMSKALNKAYPLYRHDSWEGHDSWRALPDTEKGMDHQPFREIADMRINSIKDNISAIQDKCVRITDNVIQHIGTISYAALKDSLALLRAPEAGGYAYYRKIVGAVAAAQPEYFFQLAEGVPRYERRAIFDCAAGRKTFAGLEKVKGHHKMKRKFHIRRRTGTAMKILYFGVVAGEASLVVLGIVALF